MKNPKYIEVLKYLADRKPKSIHYLELTPIIFSTEIIQKYRGSRGRKNVIDGMVCRYMGQLCRKDFAAAKYRTNFNYHYFVGYYIRPEGIKILEKYESNTLHKQADRRNGSF